MTEKLLSNAINVLSNTFKLFKTKFCHLNSYGMTQTFSLIGCSIKVTSAGMSSTGGSI